MLNYTTKIEPEKTILEIQKKLAQAKAKAFYSQYNDDGIMTAMSFQIDSKNGVISFKLPSNIDAVYRVLCNDRKVPRRLCYDKKQAARVAWRIIKVWVDAQLAIIEIGLVDVTEVFLPYAINREGQTMYEMIRDKGFKMIAHKEQLNDQTNR